MLFSKTAVDPVQGTKILVSHGIAFPWPNPDHFRFVILPSETYIRDAISRIATFLTSYRTKTHVTVDGLSAGRTPRRRCWGGVFGGRVGRAEAVAEVALSDAWARLAKVAIRSGLRV